MTWSTLEKQNIQTKGAERLTFEGGMADFRKKIFCRLISRRKNSCKEVPGEKKIPTLKKYIFHGV